MNWITNIIIVLIYPFFEGDNVKYVYILYLILTILPSIPLFIIIPETKGKTNDEIK